jgi:hypothetical protein
MGSLAKAFGPRAMSYFAQFPVGKMVGGLRATRATMGSPRLRARLGPTVGAGTGGTIGRDEYDRGN